ncbi:MAG TPA: ACP S-malonyltransferase [Steroidobacteraceae bacterium]|jgi:[acyl-carrier-protein] S-malonyltransferase|nr:ACP S-malonyltransferase [Steroidobacteraceae bacterium]
MAVAFVFPGQGSQSVGMLKSLADAEPVVTATFAEASNVLGYDLWQLCQSGPEDALNATERTQPAMLAAGVAVWRVWRKRGGPAPTVMSGHSLGEFTALVCADSLDFSTAVELVSFRGRAMQEAVPVGQGAMAAILGLEDEDVEAACREAARGEVVEPVNFNAPGQIVIAGHATAVKRAIEACKTRGAKRAIDLPVSVPSHSSLMKPAAERLQARLEQTEVRSPLVPEIYTVDVRKHGHPQGIRSALVQQLFSPVRWAETVRRMIASGVTHIVECGPGKVLTGLNRRVERRKEISVYGLDDSATIDEAITACWGTTDA